MTGWVDLHSHLVAGVDDGARDEEEARAALERLRAEGVSSIVTTPHVDGSLTTRGDGALEARLERIREGCERLQQLGPDGPLEVAQGAEVKLDVPTVDLSDSRLRLANSRAALVEFPFMAVPPRSDQALAAIRLNGYVPVLAHPERYEGLDGRLELVARWLDAGAYLQVNAASLIGRYGPGPEKKAWALLERGVVHCLASDYHSRGTPGLAEARARLVERGAEEQARTLFEVNPARLLRDESPLPVAPVSPQRRWRVLGRRVWSR